MEKIGWRWNKLAMLIGITGSFGSGKTTVSRMFGKLGAYVIDADKVYHSLIMQDKRCYKKIVRSFGKDILGARSAIDTRKLRAIVFKEKSKLKLLNSATHPEIIKKINAIVKSRRWNVVVIDAPLLLETRFYKEMDKVIVVSNKRDIQVKRIRENRGLSSEETLRRIRMQMPFSKKIAFADFIIDNSGSKENTLSQVNSIWERRGA